MKTTSLLSILLVCSLLGLLGGCFQVKPVQQYTLSPAISLPPLSQLDAPLTMLVGPVKVASYLDQLRMVKRYGATRIDTRADRQWAGDLAEMIRDLLVTDMESLLTPCLVYSYPGPTSAIPGKRVAVDILRFEGSDSKTAIVEARWILFDLQSKSISRTQTSLFQIPLVDDSYETLVAGLSQGLTLLSREIAESAISGKTKQLK